MSGGHFDYKQYHIGEISASISEIIQENDSSYEFKDDTILKFKSAVLFLELSQILAQRIDWLLSGDDGEETFHERLSGNISGFCNEFNITKKDIHQHLIDSLSI